MTGEDAGLAPLACKGVVKKFGERTVVDGVSLAAHAGTIHAVLGPSGSGKTTLLRILNLLETADAGSVSFAGAQVGLRPRQRRLDDAQRSARLKSALVLQKPVVFNTTVRENAEFGLRMRDEVPGEMASKVDAALARLGLSGLADERAWRLSGGEQQRLAFARACVLDLTVLLLDEFTANLDHANVTILEKAVRDFAAEGKAGVLLVTHDLFQARRLADEVTLLVDGAVVESAPKAEFFDSPKDERTARFVSGDAPM